jgi:hypothetical protein
LLPRNLKAGQFGACRKNQQLYGKFAGTLCAD